MHVFFSVHTMWEPATAIFPIVFALETLFHVAIQNSDVCQDSRALFDLWYILMVDVDV